MRQSRCSVAALGLVMATLGCTTSDPPPPEATPAAAPSPTPAVASDHRLTLAFAGDVHFERHLARLLDGTGPGLGRLGRTLENADLAMVNLEMAITDRGLPAAKELETPSDRFHFRAPATALDFLAEAGVDVVSVANNHGADYGAVGLRDTLRAARRGPVAVLGVGEDRAAALEPHRVTVDGTDVAVLAADGSRRESASSEWAAGPGTPGLAAAHAARPRALRRAVRTANRDADVVVVYLHWGREYRPCPTTRQRATAQALTAAGADVVVGSHAHVLLASGWTRGAYVSYGLGNFLWYHDREARTGVLRLHVARGQVVADDWVPARITGSGRPSPLRGRARWEAMADWRRLRGCADLAASPPGPGPQRRYVASVRPIGPALQERLRASHGPGCPTRWADLRLLRMTHVGFDGRDHVGTMVIGARYAEAVTGVFRRLHAARFPLRRMRTVDVYGGNDGRSMAANNTSGFNCRRVAGSRRWSAHAFGAAIDVNPVQNPYLRNSTVAPSSGRRFARVDRGSGDRVPRGVIRQDGIVVRAFAAIGWEWGGDWRSPDYQHFAAPGRPDR